MKKNNQSIHGLSDGTGLFWSLRSFISPSRDITLNPKEGVFEEEQDESQTPVRQYRKRTPPKSAHQTYSIGGQVAQIYTQTLGRQFAILG